MTFKDTLLRYFLIDKKIHQEPPPTTEELRIYLEEIFRELVGPKITISKLTVKNDIKNMRKVFFAPIKFSFEKNCYYYESPEYESLFSNPHGIDDIFLSFLKIRYSLGKNYSIHQCIHNDNKTIAGSEQLQLFTRAIAERRKVRFTYKSFNAKRTRDYIFHPYLIRDHRNTYYIIGKKDLDNDIRSFALHRIEGVAEILLEDSLVDEAYSRQILVELPSNLLALGNRLLEITIEGQTEILSQLLEVPIHPSQEVVSNSEDKFRISISALPTDEMISSILQFGDKIEVISPEKFRAYFADRVYTILQKYSGLRA
jgi:hypothetical protein